MADYNLRLVDEVVTPYDPACPEAVAARLTVVVSSLRCMPGATDGAVGDRRDVQVELFAMLGITRGVDVRDGRGTTE